LYYFGAGTSGRLGVLDASECPPTFGVSNNMVIGIIAGGDRALRYAIEGAEDDIELGKKDASVLDKDDCCVLISASGNPSYLLGVANIAKNKGAKIVALTCNPEAKIIRLSDIAICPVVGAEVISGSSRLKAGTAQKMVLNMLSTASMIRIGKTYENFMIDVRPTNQKLKKRAIDIVADLTKANDKLILETLEEYNWKVKTAVLKIKKNISKEEANEILNKNRGILRKALDE
jgi:N-acetylmuramic acid 6-phosphate etherase